MITIRIYNMLKLSFSIALNFNYMQLASVLQLEL